MIVRKDINHSSIPNKQGVINSPLVGSPTNSTPSLICSSGQEIQSQGPTVSLFWRVKVYKKNPTNTHTNLYEVLQDIRNGTGSAPVAGTTKVRSFLAKYKKGEITKQEYDEAKTQNLQAVVPACLMEGSHILSKGASNLLQHIPIINIDIDVKDNPGLFADEEKLNQFLDKLKAQSQVIAFWRSISYGISILYKLQPDQVYSTANFADLKKYHKNVFLNIKKEFAAQGVLIDKSCTNVNRLRLINHDPQIFINPLFEQTSYDKIPGYIPAEDLASKPVKKPRHAAKGAAVESANEIVNAVIKYAYNAGESFSDGHRNDFTRYVVGEINRYGVSLEDAENALNEALDFSSYPAEVERLHYIYENWTDQHGIKVFTKLQSRKDVLLNYVPKVKPISYDATITRYLTEFELPAEGNFILNVPTNAGKTFYYAKVATGKRILLVPSVALAKQVQADYGIKAVHEGVSVDPSDKVLVATYESLPKIETVLNLFDFDLWVDEAHSFVQASSKSFRNKQLSYVANRLTYFNRVILLSGTWIPTSAPMFSDFTLLNIHSATKQLGKFHFLLCDNKKEVLKSHISQSRDVKHAIYYNDKVQGQALAQALQTAGLGEYLVLNRDNQKRRYRTALFVPAYYRIVSLVSSSLT